MQKANDKFSMVWDPQTGKFYPVLGRSKGEKGRGLNAGRFRGDDNLVGDPKNPNFTAETLISSVVAGEAVEDVVGKATTAAAVDRIRTALDGIAIGKTTTLWGHVVTRQGQDEFEVDTWGRKVLNSDAAVAAILGLLDSER